MSLAPVIRELMPPLLLRLWRSVRRKGGPGCGTPVEWEYIPQGWAYSRTHPEVKGWNVPGVLETYKRKWPRFTALVQSSGPLGLAHESDLASTTDLSSHNTIMSFAYVLTLAARHKDSMSMLDWGGGIGHYYLLARTLLPEVIIDYHCKEVSLLASYGAEILPDQHFYSDETCLRQTYDLVMASTSLHYEEDWRRRLAELAGVANPYLYIARLPTVVRAPSYVFIQRPYSFGYQTEYLGWCLNQAAFLEEARNLGLVLLREFVVGETPPICRAPEACQYRGFLFRQSNPSKEHRP